MYAPNDLVWPHSDVDTTGCTCRAAEPRPVLGPLRPDVSYRSIDRRVGRDGWMLEFAILGLLQESPMHGYELRKELAEVLGGRRSISYGSLYPALKRMHAAG